MARAAKVHSPTTLVDGRDVAGEASPASAACCRIYSGADGVRGVPPIDLIVEALAFTGTARS